MWEALPHEGCSGTSLLPSDLMGILLSFKITHQWFNFSLGLFILVLWLFVCKGRAEEGSVFVNESPFVNEVAFGRCPLAWGGSVVSLHSAVAWTKWG